MLQSAQKLHEREKSLAVNLNAYYFITLLIKWYIQIHFGLNHYPEKQEWSHAYHDLLPAESRRILNKETQLDFVDYVVHDTHILSWSDW